MSGLGTYPYDRLAPLARFAEAHDGGAVDLSVGSPADPAPFEVRRRLAQAGDEHGYPSSVGSPAFREAAAQWLGRRFGVALDPAAVAACVGTKEFVASAPQFLRLLRPERSVVLVPEVAYPTYEVGARLAGLDVTRVPLGADGSLALDAIPPEVAHRSLLLWANSPANPTGALGDLRRAADVARRYGIVAISDECYAELSWERAPETILAHGVEGVLCLHSLSKRSNMAGLRVGFYAGDRELVAQLAELRRHAGLMVPGPVQEAAAWALGDDEHVAAQRERYRLRLERLAAALSGAGLEARLPGGGPYLWVEAPAWARALASASSASVSAEVGHARSSSAFGLAEDGAARPAPGAVEEPGSLTPGFVLALALAAGAGVVVSPGELYGPGGAGHVRIATMATDDRIDLVVRRLGALDEPLASVASRLVPATLVAR
jgi:aspartate/methionine/tyrosine aminotransferase